MKTELRWLTGCAVLALCALPAACSSNVDTDEDALCGDYANEPAQAEVTIRVRNEGADPIFLGGSGCGSYVDVLLRDGAGNNLYFRRDTCSFTCEELQEHEPYDCAAGCALPPLYKVFPGGTFETSWSGTYLQTSQMPDACFYDASYGDNGCQQQVVAPDGDYVIGVNGYATVDCSNGACDCSPDSEGVCQVDVAFPSGDGELREGQVSYPGESVVEIVFD